MKTFTLLFLAIATAASLNAQWKKITIEQTEGHRAIAFCPNGNVVLAGSHSSVVHYDQVSGFAIDIDLKSFGDLELRSAVCLSDSQFVVANAGSPAYIFYTNNAGKDWEKVYSNDQPSAFIDGMVAVSNKHLFAFGDQIEKSFLFLESKDGGLTWENNNSIPLPLDSTEASFAASNSTILWSNDTLFVAVSGANGNYVLYTPNEGITWSKIPTNLRTGAGAGIFSMSYSNSHLVMVGGAYEDYTSMEGNIEVYDLYRNESIEIITPPNGYRSGVACIGSTCLTSGTTGTDVSFDGGITWKQLNEERYFSIGVNKNEFFLSGPKGALASFKY